ATAAVADLVTAAESIGDDPRRRCSSSNRGQQRHFRHAHRDIVVLGFVAEGTRHSAAARFDDSPRKSWYPAHPLLHPRDSSECLLMTVTVQQDFGRRGRTKCERQSPCFPFTHEKFLEH